ncbi:MAG: hypothetical protein KIS91_02015 [Anaerolineae bacterium]|nr:hypothetical protein [Anaerolineae bacterium]
MRFTKGKSGNPGGRPKGIQDKRTALRTMFEPHAEDLVKKAIEMGLAGDGATLRACLDRICPPIKARGEPVQIGKLKGTLAEQGRTVVEALGDGRLTPDEASTILQALVAHARIVEVDELEKRVRALEERRV